MVPGAGEDEEILATCADDQKVMLWNAQTWRLMHVFDTTDDIHEWHTLTYLALQAGGHKLCCVTQSGSGTLPTTLVFGALSLRTNILVSCGLGSTPRERGTRNPAMGEQTPCRLRRGPCLERGN